MARQVFEIPLENIPQKFAITLGGIQYLMTCKWNDSDNGGWVIDFQNGQNEEPILFCVPLVTGADLLAQYGYLGFKGKLFVYTDGNEFARPTLDNLGTESHLYFVSEDDT